MVNVSRNKSLFVSQDIYSNLWIPTNQKDKARELWNKFSEEVYPYDDIELGIRTVYFLNILKTVILENPETIFINIGAGFTSYQYLLDKPFFTIEVDYREIINVKKSRARTLVEKKNIPYRTTYYVPCNLSDKISRINAFQKISSFTNSKNTFVLCEGLFYYLPISTVENIIKNISKLQRKGDVFAFDYWKPELRNNKIYKRLVEFYSKEMGIEEKDINLFEASTLIDKFCNEIIEETNVFEQENKLSSSQILQKNRTICLEENYIKLKNKKTCTQQWL